jgi:hypothetical protein
MLNICYILYVYQYIQYMYITVGTSNPLALQQRSVANLKWRIIKSIF